MNWIDIIIILVLLIFIIIGAVKGFAFSILSLFGSTVNFFIALFLTKPVSNLLNKLFNLELSLTNTFSTKLSNISSDFDISLSSFSSQEELSSHVNNTINNSSLSGFSKKILNSTVHITTENIEGSDITLNNIISKSVATFLTLIISFVIIFILIYLLLWILSTLSKKANKVDDIRLTDRILGVIFGFVKGSFIIIFIFSILSFFNENGILSDLFTYIKESTIGRWIYTNVDGFIHKYIDLKEIFKNIANRF